MNYLSLLSTSNSYHSLFSKFNLVEQEAGARHVSGSSFNGEQREHAEHTVRVAARGEEEKQGALHNDGNLKYPAHIVFQGLLGKLKNAVKKDRNISEEREFGSGSDISSASVQSKQSTSSKMSTASKLIQRAR